MGQYQQRKFSQVSLMKKVSASLNARLKRGISGQNYLQQETMAGWENLSITKSRHKNWLTREDLPENSGDSSLQK